MVERCGVPRSTFTPTFASGRVIGWTANILEQAADSKFIRPSAPLRRAATPAAAASGLMLDQIRSQEPPG